MSHNMLRLDFAPTVVLLFSYIITVRSKWSIHSPRRCRRHPRRCRVTEAARQSVRTGDRPLLLEKGFTRHSHVSMSACNTASLARQHVRIVIGVLI